METSRNASQGPGGRSRATRTLTMCMNTRYSQPFLQSNLTMVLARRGADTNASPRSLTAAAKANFREK
eukprot:935272-Alexandrium_andersonii.AAC.1